MSEIKIYAAGTCFPPIPSSNPVAPQKFSVGHIVKFDTDLNFETYYDTYMQATTSSGPDRNFNACFQGIASNNGNVAACGGTTIGNGITTVSPINPDINDWLNPLTFLVCYNTGAGNLTSVKWFKAIALYTVFVNNAPNVGPGVWQFIEMNDDYIYVATQNQENNPGAGGQFTYNAPNNNPAETRRSNPSATSYGQVKAVIMKFKISDGSVVWGKIYTLGLNNSPNTGFTSLKLFGNALYAAFSVTSSSGGLDYIKIDPSNGFVTTSTNIVTTTTMSEGTSSTQYEIFTQASNNDALYVTFNDADGGDNDYSVEVSGTTLDSTGLSTTVSDQVEIRANTNSTQRYD